MTQKTKVTIWSELHKLKRTLLNTAIECDEQVQLFVEWMSSAGVTKVRKGDGIVKIKKEFPAYQEWPTIADDMIGAVDHYMQAMRRESRFDSKNREHKASLNPRLG